MDIVQAPYEVVESEEPAQEIVDPNTGEVKEG